MRRIRGRMVTKDPAIMPMPGSTQDQMAMLRALTKKSCFGTAKPSMYLNRMKEAIPLLYISLIQLTNMKTVEH